MTNLLSMFNITLSQDSSVRRNAPSMFHLLHGREKTHYSSGEVVDMLQVCTIVEFYTCLPGRKLLDRTERSSDRKEANPLRNHSEYSLLNINLCYASLSSSLPSRRNLKLLFFRSILRHSA